jgi:hypothetical protein
MKRPARKPGERLSNAEFARRHGVTRSAITHAERLGEVIRDSNGLIDCDQTDPIWDAKLRMGVGRPRTSEPGGVDALMEELGIADAPEDPDARRKVKAELEKERARHERVKRQKAEIELELLQGSVVRTADVARLWGELLREVKDGLEALPNRLAPLFAAEDQSHEIRVKLRTEIRQALRALPKEPPVPEVET